MADEVRLHWKERAAGEAVSGTINLPVGSLGRHDCSPRRAKLLSISDGPTGHLLGMGTKMLNPVEKLSVSASLAPQSRLACTTLSPLSDLYVYSLV